MLRNHKEFSWKKISEEIKYSKTELMLLSKVSSCLAQPKNAGNFFLVERIELCKYVRNILNKLTYYNFDIILKQIKLLNIDTAEKLNSLIMLIFEKAVDEPNFARAYAELCKNLVKNCFPVESDSRELLLSQSVRTSCQRT